MEIKPPINKKEEVIRLFLLNMHLLTPRERSIFASLIESLYRYLPIEEEYVAKTGVDKK